jgi:hypothetical protein
MSRIPVDVAPEALRGRRLPPRCAKGVIKSAVSFAVQRLLDGDLEGSVRPWDLPALRRESVRLSKGSAAQVISMGPDVLVAELRPDGRRIVFRGVDDGWRLVRFANGDDVALRPETTRKVTLHGWGPYAVLAALGIEKPDAPYTTFLRGVVVEGDGGLLLYGNGDEATIVEG